MFSISIGGLFKSVRINILCLWQWLEEEKLCSPSVHDYVCPNTVARCLKSSLLFAP
uniref:Uncharacterized protein n=1 Tax=Arion vulgaris TaxID=1028688 RepID=A0A0B7A2X9_9EUPU